MKIENMSFDDMSHLVRWNMAAIKALRRKQERQSGELRDKIQDLNDKITALCYPLGIKIEKQDGYIAIKR